MATSSLSSTIITQLCDVDVYIDKTSYVDVKISSKKTDINNTTGYVLENKINSLDPDIIESSGKIGTPKKTIQKLIIQTKNGELGLYNNF